MLGRIISSIVSNSESKRKIAIENPTSIIHAAIYWQYIKHLLDFYLSVHRLVYLMYCHISGVLVLNAFAFILHHIDFNSKD